MGSWYESLGRVRGGISGYKVKPPRSAGVERGEVELPASGRSYFAPDPGIFLYERRNFQEFATAAVGAVGIVLHLSIGALEIGAEKPTDNVCGFHCEGLPAAIAGALLSVSPAGNLNFPVCGCVYHDFRIGVGNVALLDGDCNVRGNLAVVQKEYLVAVGARDVWINIPCIIHPRSEELIFEVGGEEANFRSASFAIRCRCAM